LSHFKRQIKENVEFIHANMRKKTYQDNRITSEELIFGFSK